VDSNRIDVIIVKERNFLRIKTQEKALVEQMNDRHNYHPSYLWRLMMRYLAKTKELFSIINKEIDFATGHQSLLKYN
jgi:hypothetical protein